LGISVRRRDDRGAAALEFALVLPILLMLVFGAIQFSFWFFSAQSGSSAAREAARGSAVGELDCSDLVSSARDRAQLVASDFSVKRSYYAAAYTSVTDGTPTEPAGSVQVGDSVRIVLSYKTVDLHLPLIPTPGSGGVAGQVTETAVARVETTTSTTESC
jgi:Flp pilus assembly protein TadG